MWIFILSLAFYVILVTCQNCDTSSKKRRMAKIAFKNQYSRLFFGIGGFVCDSNSNWYVSSTNGTIPYVVKIDSDYNVVWSAATSNGGNQTVSRRSVGVTRDSGTVFLISFSIDNYRDVNILELNANDGSVISSSTYDFKQKYYVYLEMSLSDSTHFFLHDTDTATLYRGRKGLEDIEEVNINYLSPYYVGNLIALSSDVIVLTSVSVKPRTYFIDTIDFSNSSRTNRIQFTDADSCCYSMAPRIGKADGNKIVMIDSQIFKQNVYILDYITGEVNAQFQYKVTGQTYCWTPPSYANGIVYFIGAYLNNKYLHFVASIDIENKEIRMRSRYKDQWVFNGHHIACYDTYMVVSSMQNEPYQLYEMSHWYKQTDDVLETVKSEIYWEVINKDLYPNMERNSTLAAVDISIVSPTVNSVTTTSMDIYKDYLMSYSYFVNVLEYSETVYSPDGPFIVDYTCIDSYCSSPTITLEAMPGKDDARTLINASLDPKTSKITYSGEVAGMVYYAQIRAEYTGGWNGTLVTPVYISFNETLQGRKTSNGENSAMWKRISNNDKWSSNEGEEQSKSGNGLPKNDEGSNSVCFEAGKSSCIALIFAVIAGVVILVVGLVLIKWRIALKNKQRAKIVNINWDMTKVEQK